MKRCAICNSTFVGDDQFCPNDGSILVSDMSAETPTVVLSTPGRPAHYSGPTAAHSSSSSKWMVPAIGILCGLVVVLGFFAFYKSSPSDGEKKNQQASEKGSAVASPTTAASPAATPMPIAPPEQAPEAPRIVQVNSPGDRFLALRTEPSADFGAKIAEIPHGERISIGTCQQNFETIGRRKGRWCQTSYGGRTGWIYDAFVRY